ncbi:MAG: TnsA endonuclease N-terminal domain-containing protein [Armatimonadetes bacterium]|jgi:hypothetical protein|nr:TnsA endonuclease N-terminal domain-containing protein [Armatimonadota bacterium]GIV13835.1 MAG: hypothetical protein KatS3mg021_2117 [Fimbriimonadales bacterium]CUU11015.1 TnsA endonuclease N terminal [Armatimonadetes bacterium GBS]CUU34155.1 TnsA endonuclease N terminal [Armatimonadetes bacterium GXS]CUU36882.1 TnsA endonuclease N terminal [Armatimonadetes bacterium DC]
MAISKRGIFQNPTKSPWNFERYESELERRMMERLEKDPAVAKWMKRHSISIAWVDSQNRQRRYVPDFLVEYTDGQIALIEVKDPSRMESDDVKRKRSAAERWCKRRGMKYVLYTLD